MAGKMNIVNLQIGKNYLCDHSSQVFFEQPSKFLDEIRTRLCPRINLTQVFALLVLGEAVTDGLVEAALRPADLVNQQVRHDLG